MSQCQNEPCTNPVCVGTWCNKCCAALAEQRHQKAKKREKEEQAQKEAAGDDV